MLTVGRFYGGGTCSKLQFGILNRIRRVFCAGAELAFGAVGRSVCPNELRHRAVDREYVDSISPLPPQWQSAVDFGRGRLNRTSVWSCWLDTCPMEPRRRVATAECIGSSTHLLPNGDLQLTSGEQRITPDSRSHSDLLAQTRVHMSLER